MKRSARFFLLVALSAALAMGTLSPAVADPDHGDMMMGEMMGHDMMGHDMMRGLDLTDEQRGRIDRITYEAHKKHLELMSAMLEESHRQQEALAAQKPDPAAVGSATIRMHDIKRQMTELHADTHKRIESLLTKEQQEKFRHAGHGCMTMEH